MNSAIATAASGFAAISAWLGRIASNIAGAGNSAPVQSRAVLPASPDLASAFAGQSLALLAYRADARVYETAQAMNRTLLDVVA